ncbi:MAG: hypothetical protein V8Q70_07155 [Bacteroides eggerthii]
MAAIKQYYSQIAIFLLFLSTAIQATVGFARDANESFKGILALLCWGSIFYSYKQFSIFINKVTPSIALLYKIFIAVIVLSILHSLFWGTIYKGNKYFVLIGNMYAALNLTGFFFITSITKIKDLFFLRNITIIYILTSVILLIFNYDITINSYFLIYPFTYVMLYIPYVKKRHKLIIILSFILSYYAFIGGGRQVALFWGFNIIAFIASQWCNKKTVLYISLICIVLPWLLMIYSIHEGQSIFEIISHNSSDKNGLNVDTRTFLYEEIFKDASIQPFTTLLFGKGAIAYYSSDYFDTKFRLGIEVPILEWLLQAGIIYIVLFTIIITIAIIKLYKYGNSRFCMIASILIASYYFNCFISNLNGCNLSIMAFWYLIYLSNNIKMMRLNDKQWKVLLKR